MLNFKKSGIFSRNTEPDKMEQEAENAAQVLAVWGSPGCGKTTVAVKLAKYLADKKKNVILVLCDMTAPMLPCICPAGDLESDNSLGSILAATHVTDSLIKHNCKYP
jgi:MinD superfamily P-loop ATPase